MMKKFANQVKALGLRLWRDESGQGTAEYVLILVGVVAAAMMFRKQIGEKLTTAMDNVGGKITGFTQSGQGTYGGST